MIFLEEMADEAAAQRLLTLSKSKRPADYAMLGLAQGKLFSPNCGEIVCRRGEVN